MYSIGKGIKVEKMIYMGYGVTEDRSNGETLLTGVVLLDSGLNTQGKVRSVEGSPCSRTAEICRNKALPSSRAWENNKLTTEIMVTWSLHVLINLKTSVSFTSEIKRNIHHCSHSSAEHRETPHRRVCSWSSIDQDISERCSLQHAPTAPVITQNTVRIYNNEISVLCWAHLFLLW